MRHALPDAKIIAIDPEEKAICEQGERWVDTKNYVYYTGSTFKDFQDIEWGTMIDQGEIDPSKTLIFLDDHLNLMPRFSTLMMHGFRHVMIEDNNKPGKGLTEEDRSGFTPKQMFSRIDSDSEFAFNQMISYAEFPPLVPGILSKESRKTRKKWKKKKVGFLHWKHDHIDFVPPILQPDVDKGDMELYRIIVQKLNMDPDLMDEGSYMQVMNYNQICYFELQPLAPHLVKRWNKNTSEN